MADISKIKTLDGTTYDIKDNVARGYHDLVPIETKTYTNVIATANDAAGAGFFYLKVRGNAYSDAWHIKTRVKATVPGQALYETDTIFDLFGYNDTYSWYSCLNRIKSTSYRPIYYNSFFRVSITGYNNGCGSWIGFSLQYATNPTSASYKRTVEVQLLAYEGCTVEFKDSLITPTNIPDRASHTDWYVNTYTSYTNFDACSYGLKQTGDANTTTISNLVDNNGYYITDSALYRYQMLFQMDENTLTPLNNDNSVTGTTKTMLTDVEFDPFGRIYYYGTTTNVAAKGNIGAGSRYWAFNGIDLRYTFNCGTTLTANKPFYLVVTLTANGKCKIANANPWAQSLPDTNDGKYYILLGRVYSTYQFVLFSSHPIYYHDGTGIKELLPQNATATTTTAGLMSSEDKTKVEALYSTVTKSGPIVNFEAPADGLPIKSIAVNVTSVSDISTVNVTRSSNNIFDSTSVEYVYNKMITPEGGITDNSSYKYCNDYIPVKQNETYTIQLIKTTSSSVGVQIAFYTDNKTFLERPTVISAASSTGLKYATFVAPNNAAFMRFNFPRLSNSVQVERGSVATEYVDGKYVDIVASVPSEPGLVYVDTQTATTLHGKNNIWSNAGDVTVEYGDFLQNVMLAFNANT